jgi:hypothetical protein
VVRVHVFVVRGQRLVGSSSLPLRGSRFDRLKQVAQSAAESLLPRRAGAGA